MRESRKGPVKVLVVDDHPLVIEGVRRVLAYHPAIEVVGEARDGRHAVERTGELKPDVVLMDIELPRLNGIEATRRIRSSHERVKVIVLSVHTEKRFIKAALDAGASGYVPKHSCASELVTAIHAVVAGRRYLSPEVTDTVVAGFVLAQDGVETTVCGMLTEREREVLQLIVEGHSTKEIAGQLGVSGKTVGSHRERIMQKTGIHNVAGLTRYAIREGLSSIDDCLA